MAEEAQTGPDANPEQKNDAAFVTYWMAQLDAYRDDFKDWESRCKKIVRRYRDERTEKSDGSVGGSRFNALWSNIQTLLPAIYIKAPQPVAERRFLDKDPLARLASMTLERSIEVQIEVGKMHKAMKKVVLDYLLCGRGSMWERYEPTYGDPVDLGDDEQGDEAPRPVTYEKVCTDYVAWNRFRHSPAPIWEEVWWVAKEEMLTRKELRARFKATDKETGKLIADLVPLRTGDKDSENDKEKKRKQPRACVWEIWNKTDREVIFIAPDYPNSALERTDDPLSLDGFWPCPEPLYATTTNDTLVPVPDYVEYQDQADELDNLTARIKALTDAIRVNGVYDASYPELKRILSEGVDNRMIGVKNYSEFASKGGIEAAMDFVPIKDVVEALIRLYEARDRTKADMAEITGLSDIVRGQAQGGTKTATEQKIKGQFASLRLEDRKKEVARFACDAIRIVAEIVSEQFSPEILAEMTGMLPFIQDEIRSEQPPQPPMMGHNGGPPLDPGVSPPPGVGAPGVIPPAGAGMQPTAQPPIEDLAQQKFMEICSLLRDDKMRTFRIDIETDSTIEVDKQAAKDSVVELFTAVGGFLEKALPIGQVMPQLTPALGQSILFAFRRFGAGRDVEGVWEQAIDKLTQMSKNPPPKPPSPEEIKAKTEADAQAAETQRDQMRFQMEQQAADQQSQRDQQAQEFEMAIKEREFQLKEREMQMNLQFKEREMALKAQEQEMSLAAKQRETEMNVAAKERDHQLDAEASIRDHELSEAAAEREAQAGEHEFELSQKVREAKAKEAMKPKPKPRGGK
ncbi:hypothetical protein [Tardiphaga sp. 709]|uniref:hypothetical protein n=1 Tax=Tardiphaga sp. 709 TaxID=3076039 RepID=UPI0028EAEA58|nr:hypothetical protein [Tardiphaga sp. 709]WNV09963.1 hypothetical protein RSO67_01840 [Tardiphaga sp. 709]